MADNLLSSKEGTIVYLAAQDKTNKEIAETVGLSVGTVGQKLRDERIQFEVKRLKHRLFGKDIKNAKKRFDEMVEKAQDVIEEIISSDNPNQPIKPQLRFQAAQEILDRSLGKPKQTVEHQGSLIGQLFDRLDDPKIRDIIDLPEEGPDELSGFLEQATETQGQELAPISNDLDSWIDKNL